MKKILSSIIFVGILLLSMALIKAEAAVPASLKLTQNLVVSKSNNNDLYWNQWRTQSFINSEGSIITEGFGLEPFYSETYRTFAEFHIADYHYSTLETTISIDGSKKVGDRGKTEVVIYADDQRIYTKTFTNTTPSQQLKLPIPAGTSRLTFYALETKGSQGMHGAIFAYPKLTNSLPVSQKVDLLSLYDLNPMEVSGNNDDYYQSWRDKPFENVDGRLVAKAVGLMPFYSETVRLYAKYNIQDYHYSTLTTTISLENEWKTGDLGKSQVEIYADNVKLYTKTFTNTTPAQPVKVRLPENTKHITFYVLQEKGPQGNHKLIFEDPILTNELSFLPKDMSLALSSIGVSDNSHSNNFHYYNHWHYNINKALQMAEGNLVARGYGFKPFYNDTTQTYAKFYIADYDYTSLETKFSLDNKWRTGDLGNSVVTVWADNTRIYSQTFDNKTPTQNAFLNIPAKTKYLRVDVTHNKGTAGSHAIIMENPVLTHRPWKPAVNTVLTSHTSVSGKTTPRSTVYVYNGSKVIGQGVADLYGNFKISTGAQKIGTVLTITAKNVTQGISSASTYTTVKGISPTLKSSQIKVANNTGKYDTVTVSGLAVNDYVKVYNSKGTLLTTRKAAKSTEVISIKQLGLKKDKLFVSLTKVNSIESYKTTVYFNGEKSPTLKTSQIKVTNYKGKSDKVYVSGLAKYDVIKVYSKSGRLLATSKKVTGSSSTIYIKQLGTKSSYVYVSLVRDRMLESSRVKETFASEKR